MTTASAPARGTGHTCLKAGAKVTIIKDKEKKPGGIFPTPPCGESHGGKYALGGK